MKPWLASILGLVVAGCAGNTYYVNNSTGERIPAAGPTQNPDLTACRDEYQRAFAAGPALWMGEIVPDCMRARGWRRE